MQPPADSYTIQRHNRSGDVHALRYRAGQIVGISEAQHHDDIERRTSDALPGLGYEPVTGNPDGPGEDGRVEWGPPTMAWDGTGEAVARIRFPVGLLTRDPDYPDIEAYDHAATMRWLADRNPSPTGDRGAGHAIPWYEIDVHLDRLSAAARALAGAAGETTVRGGVMMRSLLTRAERMRRQGASEEQIANVEAMYRDFPLERRAYPWDGLHTSPPKTPEAYFERHAHRLQDEAWEVIP